jgi:4a-hydroxytetrahydrobiopterin dehydratase
MELNQKKCFPCEGGVSALKRDESNRLLAKLDGWHIDEGVAELRKRYKFPSFMDTIRFVNRMAELAEAEGHHPDFCVRFTVLDVALTTHAIGGLSENDFIVAAKIDRLADELAAT